MFMRSADRLDSFYEEMKEYHKKYWQDIRFGQLMSNFFGWLYGEYGIDCFFPEEARMLEYFKDYSEQKGMINIHRGDL